MSKAEILQLRAETMLKFMQESLKPALLAALLEDAGAVKVLLDGHDQAGRMTLVVDDDDLPFAVGFYWLLPEPEDTEE